VALIWSFLSTQDESLIIEQTVSIICWSISGLAIFFQTTFDAKWEILLENLAAIKKLF
jgi:hypothetical protein